MNDAAAARLSLSAGVACFPEDGSTADELVRAADAALYGAKWAARARDAMERGVRHRVSWLLQPDAARDADGNALQRGQLPGSGPP